MRFLSFVIVGCWIGMGYSQTYTSTLISLEDGLSQSTIFASSQDEKGFIWFGTEDGLNRYDGYGFKVFKHEPFDSTSLADNQVRALLTDREGRLWVGLRKKGLSLYQPETDKFRNFLHKKGNLQSISSDNITCIYQDLSGDIWVGTANGFNRLVFDNRGGLSFERFYFDENHSPETSKNYIRCMYEDGHGNFWVGTLDGLGLFNRLEKRLVKVPVFPEAHHPNQRSSFRRGVIDIVQDRLGQLWLATGMGLLRWNTEQDTWAHYLEAGSQKEGEYFISDLAIDLDGDILVATMGEGLYVIPFDEQTAVYRNKWHHYGTDDHAEVRLEGQLIRSILLDRLNPDILWIGHSMQGVEKLTRITSHFYSDPMNGPALEGLSSHYISQLAKDSLGNVWFSTELGLGLRKAGGGHMLYRHEPGKPNSLSRGMVSSLSLDQQGVLWVATSTGLDRLRLGNDGSILIEHCELEWDCNQGPYSLVYEDPEGFVYVATEQGLSLYNPESQQFWPCSIHPLEELSKHFGYRIFSIHRDAKNRLWIGTSEGLLLFRDIVNPQEDLPKAQPELYQHKPGDPSSIRNHTALCIREDQFGDIWLGTFNGLLKVEDQLDKVYFQAYTEREGLANNVVYGILEDDETHCLWMSTNNGLSKFNPVSLEFENFDSSDGLQSNEFNSLAFFKGQDGEMLFGGINGYTRFYPSEILRDTIPPQVWITSFTGVDNTEQSLLDPKKEPLKLNYQQNSFSINFIALNYTNPRRNQYAYKLEGMDLNWIYCGESRQVNFSKLPPGDYTFRVIGANGDGVWNRVGDAIEVHISPPYWQTPLFYILLILTLGMIFGAFHQYRLQTKVQRIMELERVRKNAAADFHDELGHKLTVISLFGEIVKKKLKDQTEILPQLNKIIENANSLYYSMKDLLWVLDPNKDSLYDLALLLKDFGDELFDKTGVAFRAEGIGENMKGHNLPMDYKRHVVLIFKEVMNNALKHSHCDNAILTVDYQAPHLYIVFKDDGQGFEIPTAAHNGNGLQNLQLRAEKIGAQLDLSSSPGGTRVGLNCEV